MLIVAGYFALVGMHIARLVGYPNPYASGLFLGSVVFAKYLHWLLIERWYA